MLVRLRRGYAQWLASGGYLLVLLAGAEIDSSEGWQICAGIAACLALPAWIFALRRSRAVADTPTSNIASAAQGYVELLGHGQPLSGQLLQTPLKASPCLWFRYRTERRRGDKWVIEASGESTECFLIDDGSGRCLVDPEGAEILPRRTDTWREGNYRYSQALIEPGEPVYVLGSFRTHSGASLDLNLRADVGRLLAEWKQEMPALLKRFDLDGDGTLDLREWELARAQARREVLLQHRGLRSTSDTHTIGRPEDGRLYLISSLPPEKIERHYRLWALAHVGVFLAALAGLWYLRSV